jgi:hypothetical protein
MLFHKDAQIFQWSKENFPKKANEKTGCTYAEELSWALIKYKPKQNHDPNVRPKAIKFLHKNLIQNFQGVYGTGNDFLGMISKTQVKTDKNDK